MSIRRYFSVCATAALLAVLPVQAGEAAYKRGDYAAALKELQPLAQQGNAHAQYGLGVMYDEGKGVAQSHTQALAWWQKAAAQGNVHAQYNLGGLYYFGEGVKLDYAQAAQWYQKRRRKGILRHCTIWA